MFRFGNFQVQQENTTITQRITQRRAFFQIIFFVTTNEDTSKPCHQMLSQKKICVCKNINEKMLLKVYVFVFFKLLNLNILPEQEKIIIFSSTATVSTHKQIIVIIVTGWIFYCLKFQLRQLISKQKTRVKLSNKAQNCIFYYQNLQIYGMGVRKNKNMESPKILKQLSECWSKLTF